MKSNQNSHLLSVASPVHSAHKKPSSTGISECPSRRNSARHLPSVMFLCYHSLQFEQKKTDNTRHFPGVSHF